MNSEKLIAAGLRSTKARCVTMRPWCARRLGPEVELLAVVKANAYGHGMVGVAKALAQGGAIFRRREFGGGDRFCAAKSRIRSSFSVQLCRANDAAIVEGGFIPSISTLEEAQAFDRAAKGIAVAINFKVDTGMGRMGVPQAEAMALFGKIVALPNIKVHSLSTHLPVSNEDADFTRAELVQFAGIVKQLRAEFPGDYKAHVLQSAGVLAFNDPPFDDRSRRNHALRHFAPPGIPKTPAAGDDVEDTHRSHSRHAGRARHQLRADVHHAARDARGDAFGRLRGRLSAASFESRGSGAGSRPALPASRTGHDGFDDDRCFAHRRTRRWATKWF